MYPRKTQIYSIGTAKSGTHTLAEIWGNQFRTAHEPESELTLETYLKWQSEHISDQEKINFITDQDKRLWLEVNSFSVNFIVHECLRDIYPHSKFILTIRNPYSWLDSFWNHQLTYSCSGNWKKMRDFRFCPELFSHSIEESVLKNNNLYTLDGYLSYWKKHNTAVLNNIPADRLLVVRTDKLNERLDDLAHFAGLKNSKGMQANSHIFAAQKKHNLLDKIDRKYLDEKINIHCKELMSQFFPEIQSYSNLLPE
jgi:hypothetical protein